MLRKHHKLSFPSIALSSILIPFCFGFAWQPYCWYRCKTTTTTVYSTSLNGCLPVLHPRQPIDDDNFVFVDLK